jgi:hypothetical protein
MASINDVYNQLVTVNATLSAIGADVNAGTTATNGVKTAVNQLDTDVKAGFSASLAALNAAVTALDAIWTIDLASAKLLFHLTQQADTMICALEHISQNTCAILTQSTIQTGLQTSMRNDASALLSIMQSAYPAAELERERLAALQAEIWKCCPPEVAPPACTYTPCLKPQPVGEPKLPPPPTTTGVPTTNQPK